MTLGDLTISADYGDGSPPQCRELSLKITGDTPQKVGDGKENP